MNEEAAFICNQCGRRFRQSRALFDHEDYCDPTKKKGATTGNFYIRTREKKKCESCDKIFVNPKAFYNHIEKCNNL